MMQIGTPQVYANGANISVSTFDGAIHLMMEHVEKNGDETVSSHSPVMTVRVPLALFKLLAYTMTKAIRDQERKTQETVIVRNGVLERLVAKEDWDAFWK